MAATIKFPVPARIALALLLPLSYSLGAPSVRITAPGEGSRYELGAWIDVKTGVSEAEAGSRVDFYAGEMRLGSSSSPPYSFTWKGAHLTGEQSLSARLINKEGQSTVSPPVRVKIKPTWEPDPGPGITPSTAPLSHRIIAVNNIEGQHWDKFAMFRRAAELGYNGVMVHCEGGLEDMKKKGQIMVERGYIDSCHALGLKVSVWVTEVTDVPKGTDISPSNTAFWEGMDARYEKILTEIFPAVDALVLRVSEGSVTVSDPVAMKRLILLIREKCIKYNKDLIFRFFVHKVGHLKNMIALAPEIPDDVIFMPKITPQDWHMRSIADPSIGHYGNHKTIVEFDLQGEYWGGGSYPNAQVELLTEQMRYIVGNGAVGICPRIDRGSGSVLSHPNEVSMWTLGLLASGKAKDPEEIWKAWAGKRYGLAASDVISALRHSSLIRQEALYADRFASVGSSCEGIHPPWDPWNWDSPKDFPWVHALGSQPSSICNADSQAVLNEEANKSLALVLADSSLLHLEKAKPQLADTDYRILLRLLQLNHRALIRNGGGTVMTLCEKRMAKAGSEEKVRLAALMWKWVNLAKPFARQTYVGPKEIKYLGAEFTVDSPFPGPYNGKSTQASWMPALQARERLLDSLGFSSPTGSVAMPAKAMDKRMRILSPLQGAGKVRVLGPQGHSGYRAVLHGLSGKVEAACVSNEAGECLLDWNNEGRGPRFLSIRGRGENAASFSLHFLR